MKNIYKNKKLIDIDKLKIVTNKAFVISTYGWRFLYTDHRDSNKT